MIPRVCGSGSSSTPSQMRFGRWRRRLPSASRPNPNRSKAAATAGTGPAPPDASRRTGGLVGAGGAFTAETMTVPALLGGMAQWEAKLPAGFKDTAEPGAPDAIGPGAHAPVFGGARRVAGTM